MGMEDGDVGGGGGCGEEEGWKEQGREYDEIESEPKRRERGEKEDGE